jgi:hypothetical protein
VRCKKYSDACGDEAPSGIRILPAPRSGYCHINPGSYIVRNELINLYQVELDLTTLCLQYLTFPAFSTATSDSDFKDLTQSGQLAFHEYAIANWLVHFRDLQVAAAEAIRPETDISDPNLYDHSPERLSRSNTLVDGPGEKDRLEFERALEDLNELYGEGIRSVSVDEEAADACRAFQHSEYLDIIHQLWSLAKQSLNADLETRNKASLVALDGALGRGREVIEKMSTLKKGENQVSSVLNTYYGETRFKCRKLTCYWFHVGFFDAKTRKTHEARHDRPFRCAFPDCSLEDMGFKNNKDLEKHERMFHPSREQQAETFAPSKPPPVKTPFACTLCPKRFTRRFHLTSHIHNHNQEKPHACSECGRPFTRKNDCTRHEKTIHSHRS